MAYSFQTFTFQQVLTSAQMDQVEANVRDHVHGVAGISGGGLELLATASASNDAAIDFKTGIDATYDEYLMAFSNIVPSVDPEIFRVRTSTDGGSSFDNGAGNYTWAVSGISDAAGNADGGSTSATQIDISGTITVGGAAGESLSGELWLHAPSATRNTLLGWSVHFINGGAQAVTLQGVGQRFSAADVDALRFFFATGNIASGEFALYGVRK